MSHEIVFREQYGALGRKRIYVKPAGKTTLVCVGPSATIPSTFYDGLVQFSRQVFLPQGYPESVSDDYFKYQLWDTLQAFCSTITGTFTTQAIMKGVGVGDTTATPFAAAITWILKDGTGMGGRILFAWFQGTKLDGDCKKWRLFADALNDFALGLELLLPTFMSYSTHILCLSTAMKSIVGVAGGATRAAITQHQAIRNNMADVSAKDGSQETFVNLCASIVGIIILATFDEGEYVWQLFTIFTVIHLFANYQAVLSLKMVTFNNARFILFLRRFLLNQVISTPEMINKHEPVILGTGMSDAQLCGFEIKLGASLKDVISETKMCSEDMKLLANFYRDKRYIIIANIRRRIIYVTFETEEKTADVIEGYYHAVLLGIAISMVKTYPLVTLETSQVKSQPSSVVSQLETSLLRLGTENRTCDPKQIPLEAMMAANDVITRDFPDFLDAIDKKGWNIQSHHFTVDEWRCQWKNYRKEHTTLMAGESKVTRKDFF